MAEMTQANDLSRVTAPARTTDRLFVDFPRWFEDLLAEIRPSLVVAIARGATRFLQLHGPTLEHPTVISHHALPFVRDDDLASGPVLLFDDSVIYGSTMAKMRGYLAHRNVLATCAAYIVDRASFDGDSGPGARDAIPSEFAWLPIRACHRLWPGAVRKHHDALIKRILETPLHYNLDFPTFYLQGHPYEEGLVPILGSVLGNTGLFRGVFDVSTPASVRSGVYRYSALCRLPSWSTSSCKGLRCRPFSKVRITFVPSSGLVVLTPVPQLVMSESLTYEDVSFGEETVASCWRMLEPPARHDDPLYGQALFRLVTSFVGLAMGDVLVRESVHALRREFLTSAITLDSEDLRAVLGVDNERAMQRIWRESESGGVLVRAAVDQQELASDIEPASDPTLLNAIVAAWSERPRLKPRKGDLLYEALGKIFLTLRSVTDSRECRRRNPDASRLDVGLTYQGIRDLLVTACGLTPTYDEISLAVDACVDNGQAVPKVVSHGSLWMRAFYSGEGEESQDLPQLRHAIYSGYSDILKEKPGCLLAPFDMQKLAVFFRDLFDWLPISTRYSKYGRVAMVGQNHHDLVAWLAGPIGSPLQIHRDANRDVLLPNPAYISYIKPTWPTERRRALDDAIQYAGIAFAGLSDEAKLLLSTCRTHRHAYNAVAVEAHYWAKEEESGLDFRTVLSSIGQDEDGIVSIRPGGMQALYWCARYMAEARKKHRVFYREAHDRMGELRRAFEAQGAGAIRFWRLYVEEPARITTVRDPEIEERFRILMALVSQMSYLTAFAARGLVEAGLMSWEALDSVFARAGVSVGHHEMSWLTDGGSADTARSYNAAIVSGRCPGRSIVTTLLPDPPTTGAGAGDAEVGSLVSLIQTCMNELDMALNEFCPEYQIREGDFPFAPEGSTRIRRDGRVEKDLTDSFVLVVAVTNTSKARDEQSSGSYIAETFGRFPRADLHVEDRGGGLFLASCLDPRPLWDIAHSATLEWARLRLNGVPAPAACKVLSHGTIRVTQIGPHTALTDPLPSGAVDRATGLVHAIQTGEPDTLKTSERRLVIDEKAAAQCATLLRLDLASQTPTRVASARFHGGCYAVDLVGSSAGLDEALRRMTDNMETNAMMARGALKLFFSYSHRDGKLRDALEKHLAMLQRQGVIAGWHDRKITAGAEWDGQIDEHLLCADIVLLLVSADFLASGYCMDVELARAMELHEAGACRVMPVILHDCDWQGAPFGKLLALPTDAKPVSGRHWKNQNEALADVARGIRNAADEIAGAKP